MAALGQAHGGKAVFASGPSKEGNRPADAALATEIEGAARGDRAMVEALFLRLLPRISNLVRYLTTDDVAAEDITQEAALAVLMSLPRYRAEGTFYGWVDRIVVRVTISRRKRSRALAAKSEESELDELPVEGALTDDDYVARRRVVRLLDALPVEQRDALVLHHALDMTVPEIAAELAISAETVRTRLRRAKARLRELAGQQGGRP